MFQHAECAQSYGAVTGASRALLMQVNRFLAADFDFKRDFRINFNLT